MAELADQWVADVRRDLGLAYVEGSVSGDDIEASADAMEDAAARLAELLASFAAGPRPSLDARAVFLWLCQPQDPLQSATASSWAWAARLRR